MNVAGLKIKSRCAAEDRKTSHALPQERSCAGEEEGGMQKTAGEREEDMLTINLTQ